MSSQVLLDDEWHALNFVADKSFPEIFLAQGMGANSIPVNIYTWVLLHTIGWSEPMLRLPSVLSGIAALVILPMLIRRLWGEDEAVIVAALLAVSPVVIFYSRIARPYMPAMLFASCSVLLLLAWVKEGRRSNLLLSALCGSVAIYYHLYTAIPVCVPYAVAFAASLPVSSRVGLRVLSNHPLKDLLLACVIMAVLVGLLVAVPNILNPWWAHGIHGMDHATFATAFRVLSLLAGTRHVLLMGVTTILLISGLILILQESRTVGLVLAMPALLFVIVMSMTTQDGAHAGIQVARYGIPFFPFSFTAIAVALVKTGTFLKVKFPVLQRRSAMTFCACALWLPFIACSPLWATYCPPNNFTGHSAFQYSYDPIQWRQSSPRRDLAPEISMHFADIPKFYLDAAKLEGVKGIIEYPMLLGDHVNLFYYYQHFHRVPVQVGYIMDSSYVQKPDQRNFVHAGNTIDFVLANVPEILQSNSSWKTMVDIGHTDRLKRDYKGWLVIVHRNLLHEIAGIQSPDYPGSVAVANRLASSLGPPLELNDSIGVWRVD